MVVCPHLEASMSAVEPSFCLASVGTSPKEKLDNGNVTFNRGLDECCCANLCMSTALKALHIFIRAHLKKKLHDGDMAIFRGCNKRCPAKLIFCLLVSTRSE